MSIARPQVLVAEDEAMIGLMLEDFLDQLGYSVVRVCASVAECESVLESGTALDLALLDCHLGVEPVWPIARRLLRTGVPFLFASGDDRLALPDDLRGIFILNKPFSMDALDRALASAVSGAQLD